MAVQIGPLAQQNCGDVSLRAEATAPAALPGLRNAGRFNSHEVPSVRREHDVFYRRRKPLARPLDAADFAGNIRDVGDLLRDVCAVVCDHDETFGWRRAGWRLDGSWRNRHSGQLSFGRFAPTGVRHRPAMAIRNSHISPWRAAAHRFQYVGADGYRADGRGNVRLSAIFVLVCCYGRGWIHTQFFGGPFKRGRVRFVAGTHRRAHRGDYGQEEHGRTGAAQRVDSLADLYRRPG